MTPAALPGYRRLLELARREAELVASGRLDELEAVWAERDALAGALPATPPAEARPLLEESLRLVSGTAATLAGGVADTRAQLGRLGRSRSALTGYAAAGGARPGAIDVRG